MSFSAPCTAPGEMQPAVQSSDAARSTLDISFVTMSSPFVREPRSSAPGRSHGPPHREQWTGQETPPGKPPLDGDLFGPVEHPATPRPSADGRPTVGARNQLLMTMASTLEILGAPGPGAL